ncbi:MAG: hypothetical protein WC557_05780 [Ignavibacteriaceae bacterium]
MKKQKTDDPQYVTKEMLKKALSKTEKRLDAKVEASTQVMKDYTDCRFTQLDTKIDGVEKSVKEQGKKMDRYFNGIVKMMEGLTGRITGDEEHLKDHEQRITKLEEQTG